MIEPSLLEETKRNYHNVQLPKRARECELIIDARGHTNYIPEGPFLALLRKHAVAVSDFKAVCLKCNLPFAYAEVS